MADIATVLNQTEAALASLQGAAAAAAAGGIAQTRTTEAAWKAVADVEAARARAQGLRARVQAQEEKVTTALAARAAAVAAAEAARTQGPNPPLALPTADALRAAVAGAVGVAAVLTVDNTLVPAVAAVDAAIAAHDDAATAELAAAAQDLAARTDAFEQKRAAVETVLAGIERAPGVLDGTLAAALVRRQHAQALSDDGEGAAAVVAYADYQAARGVLAAAAADAPGVALQAAWATARDELLSALGDLLAAQTAYAEKQLGLAAKTAEAGVRQATRDADAAAAVNAAVP